MSFDFDHLTLGEIAKIEDLSGLPIAAIADSEKNPMGKAMAALCFVASRRSGAPLKWDACLDLTMDDANEILGWDDDEADEDQGADDAGDPLGPAEPPSQNLPGPPLPAEPSSFGGYTPTGQAADPS